MSNLVNNAIKIPDQHYVGFSARSATDVPLAFLTPDGTDAAALKRKATVDRWRSKDIPGKSIKNDPLIGFKIGKKINHGGSWNSSFDKWRVEDPRGFQLEISSGNFEQIIQITTIENGEIQEKCVWGRLGSENILIPVASEIYKAAAANTERMGKKVSLKEITYGNKITVKNGDKFTYLGRVSIFGMVEKGDRDLTQITKNKNKYYAVINAAGTLEFKTSLDVSTLDDDASLSEADAEIKINEMLYDPITGGDRYTKNYSSSLYEYFIAYATLGKTSHTSLINPTIEFEELTGGAPPPSEYRNCFHTDGSSWVFGYIGYHNKNEVSGKLLKKDALDNMRLEFVWRLDNRSHSYWRGTNEPTNHATITTKAAYNAILKYTAPNGQKMKWRVDA